MDKKRAGDLDELLLEAHRDRDSLRLVDLYERAANVYLKTGDLRAGCFYLTQAYVYALESGHPEADALLAILREYHAEQ